MFSIESFWQLASLVGSSKDLGEEDTRGWVFLGNTSRKSGIDKNTQFTIKYIHIEIALYSLLVSISLF